MEIKILSCEHFYELRDLLDGVFSRSYGRETKFIELFPRLFSAPNAYVTSSHLGAFIDGRLVGTAAMYPLDYVVGGVPIRLIANGNVAVHEDYRKRGVMTQLLHAVNDACDVCGDLGYLHGNPVRYGRVGYIGGGIQYTLTFDPAGSDSYTFEKMLPEECAELRKLSETKCDYIRRKTPEDFYLALHSGNREAVTVHDRRGNAAGYLSLNLSNAFVEEFAFTEAAETEIFRTLAYRLGRPVQVRLSGYDKTALERCGNDAKIENSQPALFRMIRPEQLKEAARSLGLSEDVVYAPYLT